jgi:hypothetical protein
MIRSCAFAIIVTFGGCATPAPPRHDEGVLVVQTPPLEHPDDDGPAYVGYEVTGADGRVVRWSSGLWSGKDALALLPGLYAVRGLRLGRLTNETRLVAVVPGEVAQVDVRPPDEE